MVSVRCAYVSAKPVDVCISGWLKLGKIVQDSFWDAHRSRRQDCEGVKETRRGGEEQNKFLARKEKQQSRQREAKGARRGKRGRTRQESSEGKRSNTADTEVTK